MFKKLKNWAAKLKRQAKILQLVYKDKRTPVGAKILIWLTLGYLFSPIDLIPDFIPVLGILDDIIIVPLMIAWIIKLIPKIVMEDAAEEARNLSPDKEKPNIVIIILICLVWITVIYWTYQWLKSY